MLLVYLGKLWTPQSYIISDKGITIVRIIGRVVIFRKEIESIEIKSGISLAGQLFGSGGVAGYYGKFILDNGKKITLYCTRIDKVVLIRTKTKVYGISPENIEDFYQKYDPANW
ncbi:MAG: PH domain-containing protein [Pelosinus sp.]|nr:PH domain-containing protein [Pelosinus sp.]